MELSVTATATGWTSQRSVAALLILSHCQQCGGLRVAVVYSREGAAMAETDAEDSGVPLGAVAAGRGRREWECAGWTAAYGVMWTEESEWCDAVWVLCRTVAV